MSMLEACDLSSRISKENYGNIVNDLENKAGELQREVRKKGKSVIIVMEGWRGSGITQIINLLLPVLDPRGTRIYPIEEPKDVEREHNLFWRFWTRLPAYGLTAIFDRSWYTSTIVERYDSGSMVELPASAIADIINFELQLISDGNLILKFFLHISKEEQKKRLEEIKDSPFTMQARYLKRKEGLYMVGSDFKMIDRMLMKTDIPSSPWIIVEAEQMKYAHQKILLSLNSTIQYWLSVESENQDELYHSFLIKSISATDDSNLLDKADLTKQYTRQEYKPILTNLKNQIRNLQIDIYNKKISVIILFEGWDAAGKGGCIIRLAEALNPRGYVVEPIGSPNDWERLHHYLWRFYIKFPKKGHITIFDRSWYGRVMVERIEKFCSETEWQRAYHEIALMEDELTQDGTILLKFWLHIDKDEQLKRFKERQQDPAKNWKITEEDWRNREKWDVYKVAVNDMIRKTTTAKAPWIIVPANNKYYARIMILEKITEVLTKKLIN